MDAKKEARFCWGLGLVAMFFSCLTVVSYQQAAVISTNQLMLESPEVVAFLPAVPIVLLWQDVTALSKAIVTNRLIIPQAYRVIKMDVATLLSFLPTIPMEDKMLSLLRFICPCLMVVTAVLRWWNPRYGASISRSNFRY